jgi:hypothetical protein
MDWAPGVGRPLLKDRPAPLTFFDDYLDFYNHDHHHQRQEVVSCKHSDLRVLSRWGSPAGFFMLTAKYEQIVYAGHVIDHLAANLLRLSPTHSLDYRTAPGRDECAGPEVSCPAGDRHGQFAVSVSGNWCIAFSFEGENATDVDLVDYQ